jgi:hypothetical protein
MTCKAPEEEVDLAVPFMRGFANSPWTAHLTGQMDRQEEQIAHELEIITPANLRKTAQSGESRQIYQFVIHRLVPGYWRASLAHADPRSQWSAALHAPPFTTPSMFNDT